MEPSGRTPSRKPVMDHDGVVSNTVDYLRNKHQWRAAVETEMQLPKTSTMKKIRRADVVAWNQSDREFYIVEAKATWSDFQADMKFMEYKDWCTYMAFAVPEELATPARLWMEDRDGPRAFGGVGLLVIPNDFSARRMVRKPKRRPMSNERYLMMIERWALSCRGRLVGAREKIDELRYYDMRLHKYEARK